MTNYSLPKSSESTPLVEIPKSVRLSLWMCFGAWAISFFLPVARIDGRQPAAGWTIALDAIVLLLVPVKGAWLGFFPSIWTVFINLFMLLLPVEIKAIEKGEGRSFAVLFSLATAVPVLLAYAPPSLGLLALGFPLLMGFYVWEFSMIMTAMLLMRLLWSGASSWMPGAVLTVLLFCVPIRHREMQSRPEPVNRTATAQARVSPNEMPGTLVPTTITLGSSSNPSVSGDDVTFSARVSVPWGYRSNGTVRFTDIIDNKVIGTVHTADGSANVSISTLAIGEHPIQASFVADASDRYESSETTLVQVVQRQSQHAQF